MAFKEIFSFKIGVSSSTSFIEKISYTSFKGNFEIELPEAYRSKIGISVSFNSLISPVVLIPTVSLNPKMKAFKIE